MVQRCGVALWGGVVFSCDAGIIAPWICSCGSRRRMRGFGIGFLEVWYVPAPELPAGPLTHCCMAVCCRWSLHPPTPTPRCWKPLSGNLSCRCTHLRKSMLESANPRMDSEGRRDSWASCPCPMFPVPMRKCPNLCQSAKGWGWRASALWWCAQGVGKPSSSPALVWKGVGKPSLRPVLVCKGCPSLKRMPAFVTSTDHIRSDHCYNQSSHATSSMGLKGRALLWLTWITSSKRSSLSLTCRTYATFMSSIIFLMVRTCCGCTNGAPR